MSFPDAYLDALERVERVYLLARGWKPTAGGGLWIDPEQPTKTHVDRKAAYLQRQRDTAAENQRLERACPACRAGKKAGSGKHTCGRTSA